MQKYVNITPHGIERVLRGQNFSEKSLYKSISEYIWNGFDASATKINVDFSVNQMGKINSLSIKDNGFGIDVGALDLKFGPFYDSEKFVDVGERNHSMPHGRKGIGRLTFFAFAGLAEWNTIFKSKGSKNKKYVITMQSNNLRNYDISPKVEETKDNSGTVVKFSRFFNETRDNFDSDGLEKYLGLEFGWWLELNKDSPFEIIVNKKKLDYKKLVNETKELEIKLNDSIVCELKYVQWKEKIHDEFSKFYYISSKGEEQYKENTTLNNKGDEFYHSVFIKSTLFDNFSFLPLEDTSQTNLTKNRNSEEFKLLRETVDNFLRKKRKPFLKETSYKLIEELEKDGVIPKETSNEIETIKKEDLENVLKGIYEIQPKVFSQLNLEQKKTMVGFFNLVLGGDERDEIIEIIASIVELEPAERQELSNLLKVTNMSSIIKTAKLVTNRLKVIEILKKVHFDNSIKADEVNHLQKIVEDNTWIFGEQYALLAAAEDTFDKALRNYRKEFYDSEEYDLESDEFKNGQMDIFLCRQAMNYEFLDNLVIELKHPKKALGEEQLSQVKKYYRKISSTSQFNGDKTRWRYILAGAKYDSSKYIEGELKSKDDKEEGLVYSADNHKIFVKKWSDILFEAERSMLFLQEKLNVQKSKLVESVTTAEEAVLESKI